MDNRPIFSAVTLGEKKTFKAHCVADTATTARAPPTQDKNPAPIPEPETLESLGNLTQEMFLQVIALIRATLTRTKSPVLLYKALQFRNEHTLESWITKMRDSPHNITGWISSLTEAVRESIPN